MRMSEFFTGLAHLFLLSSVHRALSLCGRCLQVLWQVYCVQQNWSNLYIDITLRKSDYVLPVCMSFQKCVDACWSLDLISAASGNEGCIHDMLLWIVKHNAFERYAKRPVLCWTRIVKESKKVSTFGLELHHTFFQQDKQLVWRECFNMGLV